MIRSLVDGLWPVVIEDTVDLHFDPPWPDAIAMLFQKKYGRNIRADDSSEHMLVEITPERLINW